MARLPPVSAPWSSRAGRSPRYRRTLSGGNAGLAHCHSRILPSCRQRRRMVGTPGQPRGRGRLSPTVDRPAIGPLGAHERSLARTRCCHHCAPIRALIYLAPRRPKRATSATVAIRCFSERPSRFSRQATGVARPDTGERLRHFGRAACAPLVVSVKTLPRPKSGMASSRYKHGRRPRSCSSQCVICSMPPPSWLAASRAPLPREWGDPDENATGRRYASCRPTDVAFRRTRTWARQ